MKFKLLTVAAVLFFVLSGVASAAEWKFYGTASINTFWADSDLNDTTQFSQVLNPGANIGAEVQASDSVSGGFEYGTENGSANIVTLWGQWDFGAGSLLVGQDEVLAYQGISGQVYDDDRALDGLGEFNPGERAQIRLTFGAFEIAAVEPNTQIAEDTDTDPTTTTPGLSNDGSEVKIPNIQVRYTFNNNNFDAGIAGGFGSFDHKDEDVTSYVALASIGVTVNRFRLAAQGWFGQNVGNIAAQDTRGDGEDGFAIYEGNRIHDVDAWGAALVAQMVVNDMLSLEVGYGYVDLDYGNATLYGNDSDEVQSYYLSIPVTLAEGVSIVPEVGVIDYNESGQDEVTYGGAKWQIEF